MKKLIAILTATVLFWGWGSKTTLAATANHHNLSNAKDTLPTASNTPSAYAEGDVMMRDGSWVVYSNGEWKAVENDLTLDNGVVIKKTGEIVDKNGKTAVLKNGERVSKAGLVLNKADKAVDNTWDATRNGVSHAAETTEGKVKKGYDAAKGGVTDAAKTTKSAVGKAKDVTKNKVGNVGQTIKEKAQKIGDAAKEVKEDWKD